MLRRLSLRARLLLGVFVLAGARARRRRRRDLHLAALVPARPRRPTLEAGHVQVERAALGTTSQPSVDGDRGQGRRRPARAAARRSGDRLVPGAHAVGPRRQGRFPRRRRLAAQARLARSSFHAARRATRTASGSPTSRCSSTNGRRATAFAPRSRRRARLASSSSRRRCTTSRDAPPPAPDRAARDAGGARGDRRPRPVGDPPRAAAAARDRGDRGDDRGRRPLPARRARRREHGGRSPRPLAERDARADRVAVQGAQESVGASKLRRFVADASHELRTPLAAVRAYAELFGRGAADRPEDLARSMTGSRRESERMSLLVEDLLLLARLDEGRPLEREQVDLARGRRARRSTPRASSTRSARSRSSVEAGRR